MYRHRQKAQEHNKWAKEIQRKLCIQRDKTTADRGAGTQASKGQRSSCEKQAVFLRQHTEKEDARAQPTAMEVPGKAENKVMFDTDTCPTAYQYQVLQAGRMMGGCGPARQKGSQSEAEVGTERKTDSQEERQNQQLRSSGSQAI